ncbi:MAG: prephenate dehydrogenase [Ruminococcus sp.]|nr:prephenate dehydrogenase [Ruminococcus sp.]
MNILTVGLGLIGGSFCKALKKYTDNRVIGTDKDKSVEERALSDNSIDEAFSGDFSEIDLIVICLYPDAAEKYFISVADKLKKGTVITDVCGIKGEFAEKMNTIAIENGLDYVGVHPMAGREFGGYENSIADLFQNSNFILTPFQNSNEKAVEMLKKLAIEIGAKKLVVTTPYEHDKIIAYTSQLAHVVSSAYVKSPVIEKECGFSGGSFQDMTRIATMNEEMWSTLFLQNKANLLDELNTLISNLNKYSKALEENDKEALSALIKEGKEIKKQNLKNRLGQPN